MVIKVYDVKAKDYYKWMVLRDPDLSVKRNPSGSILELTGNHGSIVLYGIDNSLDNKNVITEIQDCIYASKSDVTLLAYKGRLGSIEYIQNDWVVQDAINRADTDEVEDEDDDRTK